ncbi:MAG: hypothetical protein J7J46_04245 [Candidatus Desulfofervidus sp.]|nr:hypothetical protein [Candidatus Desulfofervidus sp.]
MRASIKPNGESIGDFSRYKQARIPMSLDMGGIALSPSFFTITLFIFI